MAILRGITASTRTTSQGFVGEAALTRQAASRPDERQRRARAARERRKRRQEKKAQKTVPTFTPPEPPDLDISIGPAVQEPESVDIRRQRDEARGQAPAGVDVAQHGAPGLFGAIGTGISSLFNLGQQQAAAPTTPGNVPASLAPFEGGGAALAGAAQEGAVGTLELARQQAIAEGNLSAAQSIGSLQESLQQPLFGGGPAAQNQPAQQTGFVGEMAQVRQAVNAAARGRGLEGNLTRGQFGEAARLTAEGIASGFMPDAISEDVALEMPFLNPQSSTFREFNQAAFGQESFDNVQDMLEAWGYVETEDGRWEIQDPIINTGYGGGSFQGGSTRRSRRLRRGTRGSARSGRRGFGGLVNWRIGFG